MNYLAILFFGFIATPLIAPTDQSKEIEHRAKVKPSQRIEIKGLSGAEIEFKTWEKEEVYMKLTLRISSSDEDYETEYINSFEVQERVTDGSLVLAFKEPSRGASSGFWSIFKGRSYTRKEITGEVFLPSRNPLTTDLSYGALSMSGIKGELNILGKNNTLTVRDCANIRRVTNDYGKTEIENGGGSLDLSGTSSTVTVVKFAGPAFVDANYSNITMNAVTDNVRVKSQSGTHTLEDIGGNLTVRSNYSNITVSQVKGLLDVTSQSGKLRARNVRGLVVDAPYTNIEAVDVTGIDGKDVVVASQSATINLENITGNTIVTSPYSTIGLKNIDGSVDLENTSGRVNAQDVSGNWKSRTEYTSLRLKGLKSKEVIMSNKSERIEVDLLVVPSTVEIRNEYGSVSVDLPKGFAGDISLDAEYGKVDTDFGIQTRNRGSSGYAVGKVGSGTGKITIETRSGNIELNQK
jgi:hypothetical protein